jgi:hypothetical protein
LYNVAVFGGGAVVRCSALLLGATLIFGTVRSLVWAGLGAGAAAKRLPALVSALVAGVVTAQEKQMLFIEKLARAHA